MYGVIITLPLARAIGSKHKQFYHERVWPNPLFTSHHKTAANTSQSNACLMKPMHCVADTNSMSLLWLLQSVGSSCTRSFRIYNITERRLAVNSRPRHTVGPPTGRWTCAWVPTEVKLLGVPQGSILGPTFLIIILWSTVIVSVSMNFVSIEWDSLNF